MCNRYRIKEVMEVQAYALRLFNALLTLDRPRWNVAPNQVLPIIVNDDSSRPTGTLATWNLVPFFDKSPKPAYLRTNARSEEVLAKPSYRDGVQRRRCVVPADGFYEWEHLHDGRVKIPWLFERREGRPFSFAGIWEFAHDTHPPSFTILTTTPNPLVARIHNRMPVLLDDDQARLWLAPGALTAETLQPLVAPFPADAMRATRINPALNSVRNDTAEAAAPQPVANTDDPLRASGDQAEFNLA